MGEYGVDVVGGVVALGEDFAGFCAVLGRELLVIEVVDEADEAPFFDIFVALAGEVSHGGFNGEGVLDGFVGVVEFFEECEGLFAGGGVSIHGGDDTLLGCDCRWAREREGEEASSDGGGGGVVIEG